MFDQFTGFGIEDIFILVCLDVIKVNIPVGAKK